MQWSVAYVCLPRTHCGNCARTPNSRSIALERIVRVMFVSVFELRKARAASAIEIDVPHTHVSL